MEQKEFNLIRLEEDIEELIGIINDDEVFEKYKNKIKAMIQYTVKKMNEELIQIKTKNCLMALKQIKNFCFEILKVLVNRNIASLELRKALVILEEDQRKDKKSI